MMLSFYEMNRLLNKSKKKLNEGIEDHLSPEQMARLGKLGIKLNKPAAPQAAPAAKPTSGPANVEATPDSPAGQLPQDILDKIQQARSAAGTPKPAAGAKATTPRYDTNDPNNLDLTKKPTVAKRVSGSKAMNNTAESDPRKARESAHADRIAKWNTFLRSPTYQCATALALKELGLNMQIPQGPFTLAARPTGQENELLAPLGTWTKVVNKANEILGNDRDGEPLAERQGDLKAKLAERWNPNLGDTGINQTIMRAIQFEGALHDPDIMGKPMTMEQLAQALAQKAVKGGLDVHSDDLGALKYLMSVATKHGYNNLFNVNGDTVTVVPLHDLGATGDPLAAKKAGLPGQVTNRDDRIAQNLARKKAAQGDANNPLSLAMNVAKRQATPGEEPTGANESADWMDIYELCEHWQF